MKKPSVLFYEPPISGVNEYAAFVKDFPLIGPLGMATMLRDKGYPVTAVNGNISPLTREDMRAHDVLALSALTPSVPGAYQAALDYKAVNRKGRVIIGGPHVTFLPEEALRFADQVGTGEGEGIIEGMVLGDFQDPVVNGAPVENLDEVVIPDPKILRGYKRRFGGISTTRGCPHDCSFCSVVPMYGRKQRQVSVDNAVYQFTKANKEARSSFVYDDNFVAKRKWAMEVLDELAWLGISHPFLFQARSTVGNDKGLLEKLAAAHASTACVGFESQSPEVLAKYNKGQSLPVVESVEGFHSHKIAVQGMFIYDEETDYLNLPMDYIQITVLTPVPGSRLFDDVREKGQFLRTLNPFENSESWRNWQYFDGTHVVFSDPLQKGEPESFEKLAEIQERVVRLHSEFYYPTRVLRKRKLKGGIDWKLLKFWQVANRARRNNWQFVERLRQLGEWKKRGFIIAPNGKNQFGMTTGREVRF